MKNTLALLASAVAAFGVLARGTVLDRAGYPLRMKG